MRSNYADGRDQIWNLYAETIPLAIQLTGDGTAGFMQPGVCRAEWNWKYMEKTAYWRQSQGVIGMAGTYAFLI